MPKEYQTDQIPTPALLVDLDAFESNLRKMASHAREHGKALRPHAKAHKCPAIARRQLAAGAVGLCVATITEAELMTKAGVASVLLTSPIADPVKMSRIVATGAMVVVDHVQQVAWYEDVARVAERAVEVLVDLDIGDHRTGALPGTQALEIAKAAGRAKHLRLRGLQAYSVRGSHVSDRLERTEVSQDAFRIATETREAMKGAGLPTEILTGGSTGTWDIDSEIPDVTELQAGSYALMDLAYQRLGIDFHNAMTVLTTVISANHDGFVTVDGGFKAFSTDRAYGPEAVGLSGSEYRWGGDEFGYVDVDACNRKPRLGERIEFIPPHCDPTVNLYDRIYACRGKQVEDVWPVKRLSFE
jgi:3-hydroxy-D-aspartate aldolase